MCIRDRGDTLLTTGSISSGSQALFLDEPVASASAIGKKISVAGAGTTGLTLGTTIAAYVSSVQLTLTDAALTTATNADVGWGTDDTDTILAAFDEAKVQGRDLMIPSRLYTVCLLYT